MLHRFYQIYYIPLTPGCQSPTGLTVRWVGGVNTALSTWPPVYVECSYEIGQAETRPGWQGHNTSQSYPFHIPVSKGI